MQRHRRRLQGAAPDLIRTRPVRALLALVVGLLLVAGSCSKEPKGASPASGPPRPTLRVGFAADDYAPESGRQIGVTPLNTNVVETLVGLGPNLELQPLLAKSWELVPPNTWRFHLRENVTFHNGKHLDAAAVKEGLFDRIADGGGGQIRATRESTKIVDDLTIDFTSKIPNLRVPEMLAHPGNGAYAPGSDVKKPVGTGPFQFVDYSKGERIVVERYDGYWNTGAKAKSKRIEFTFYPSSSDRIEALLSGKVDVAFPIPPQDAAKLDVKGIETVDGPEGGGMALYAAAQGFAPFDFMHDPSLRRAVALAIDRKKLVTEVLRGKATNSQTFVPQAVLGASAAAVKGFSYDPKKAGELLDAAGWKAGSGGIRQKEDRKLELTLISGYPSADINRPVPEFLKTQLRAVGIGLKIVEAKNPNDYASTLNQSNGDLYLEQVSQTDANPAFMPLLIYNWDFPSYYQRNFSPGPTFDQALTTALAGGDAEQVRAATAAALKEAIDTQATIIPLAGIKRLYAFASPVQGFVAHPSYFQVRWDTVSFGK